jgi:hypothetical protein
MGSSSILLRLTGILNMEKISKLAKILTKLLGKK